MKRAGMFLLLLCWTGCGQRIQDSALDRVIRQTKSADPNKRLEAVRELSREWGDKPAVIDALAAALADDDLNVSNAAARGLSNIGNPAADALLAELKNDHPAVRSKCVEILSGLNKPDAKVGPAIVGMLKDPDPYVRANTAQSIKNNLIVGAKEVPDLVAALNDDSAIVRLNLVECLGKLGPVAESARPALEKLLSDSDDQVRKAAHTALQAIN